ncbi:MAG: outer membrane beta-barrel protein, partial [Stellaceae bacterium]
MSRLFADVTVATIAGLCAALAAPIAHAEDKPPAAWSDTIKFSGFADAGIMGNPDAPQSGLNWGRLFDDRANSPELNQLTLTLARPTDPNVTGYDFGFTLNGLYGSDARYTHFLGEFATATHALLQFTPLEADVLVHMPWFSDAGVDTKIGQFPS